MTPGMPVSVAFDTGPEGAADGPGGRAAGGPCPGAAAAARSRARPTA